MNTVAVLMSTYNGGKYLREQIDSILAQTNVAVSLFVRDDGSSDGTEEILAEYATKDGRVRYEMCENVGVGNSFMNLLYSVPDTFDYYAFSDQDDIWLPEKLSEGIKMLEESGALLYASNQECVDRDGNSRGLRYAEEREIFLSPVQIMERNMISGCTMAFGKDFRDILTEEEHRPTEKLLRNRIHDVWLAEVAALCGKIAYDKRAFIQYRQHENNVVGANEHDKKRDAKERKKKLANGELRRGRSKLAAEICEKFPEHAKKYPLLGICAGAGTCKGKRKIIKNGKALRAYTGEGRFAFFLKVMLGWF